MNLEKFLRNLVLGEKNELKNRFLHIGFKAEDNSGSKSKNCTLEELAALRFLKGNPKATQEQVAKHLGRSERTIESMTVQGNKGLLDFFAEEEGAVCGVVHEEIFH